MVVRIFAFTVVCLSCTGHGSRVHIAGEQISSTAYETEVQTKRQLRLLDPWRAFATVLLAFNSPAIRWQALPDHNCDASNPSCKRVASQAQALVTGDEERPGRSLCPRRLSAKSRILRERKDFAAMRRTDLAATRRTVITQLLAGSLASTVIPAIRTQALPVTEAVRVFEVAKAALDPRSYRALMLANGMRVLLASDPSLSKAAAAVDVQVGWMTDPREFPGLAHFCEHMLFLGTKKFPKEGDFEALVAQGGGSNNAYTDSENTNYFFDVQGQLLKTVLQRFAGFFTEPLFTESATSREVNAINSEHQKNVNSDFWRLGQLTKLRADQSHPYAKFGTGTRETLRNGDTSAREALLKFHERYYQADRMSLAMIGPQPLDELQELAVSNFQSVPSTNPPLPSANDAYDNFPLPFRPASSAAEAFLMVPVRDARALKLTYCVPITNFEENWVKQKPDYLWALLLGNRAKGGLTPYLKRRGLAQGVSGGVGETTRTWALLSVDVSLTPLGLKEWREVASVVFAYMRKLRDSGPPSTLAKESWALDKVNFEYAEPRQPQKFASGRVTALPFYPPEQWITASSLTGEGGEEGALSLLRHCAEPANALVTLIAQSNAAEAKFTEPIYGTRYGKLDIAREIDEWRNAKIPEEFSLPEPNKFIPTDFSIKCAAGGRTCIARKADGTVVPRVVEDKPGLRIHFLQDSTFLRPRGFAFFFFMSPLLEASPKASVVCQLFSGVFADVLQESTYQVALAGSGAGVGADYNGISLSATGWSSSLLNVASYVGQQVRSAELTASAFERQLESFKRNCANFKLSAPVGLASYFKGLALETPRFSNEELAAAAENVTLADLVSFQKTLLQKETLLEAFLAGNLAESDASKITESVRKAFPSAKPLPADKLPQRQVRVLQPGRRVLQQFVASNPAETNSAVNIYVQIGMDEGNNWLLAALISQLISEPFFDELRTKQQLGYIVQTGLTENERVRGFGFSVQSTVLPPPELEERVNGFLTKYRADLAGLSEVELKLNKDALASKLIDVDKTLGAQTARFWEEMVNRRYDYARPWNKARIVEKVTREDLLAFYDRFLLPDSPTTRRLSTHVFAPKGAPATLVVESLPNEFYPAPPDEPLPKAALKGA